MQEIPIVLIGHMRKIFIYLSLFFIILIVIAGFKIEQGRKETPGLSNEPVVVKVGYFPNITHARAVVGIVNGDFQEVLGKDVIIKVRTFNAGPSEIEALFVGEIDIGYIGPSPAINGYIKSNGEALRIIGGAASGGASLVVQPDLALAFEKEGIRAFIGKKIASPQQGNTQDISLRHYLKENNLSDKTLIVPIANADQLTMFALKQLDGAWAPEPWASRLIKEAGGIRLIDERELWPDKGFCTANIIVRTKFLEQHPELVQKWLQAHIEITEWINTHPEEAKNIVNSEIEKLTTKKLPDNVLSEAWQMLSFTVDPLKSSVLTFADWAYSQGFLGEKEPDLTNLYDLKILNEVTNTKY